MTVNTNSLLYLFLLSAFGKKTKLSRLGEREKEREGEQRRDLLILMNQVRGGGGGISVFKVIKLEPVELSQRLKVHSVSVGPAA